MSELANQDLRTFALAMQQTKGFGSKTALALLGQVGGISELFDLWRSGNGPAILSRTKLEFGERIQTILDQKQIGYVCIWEDDYPGLLKQIADPPLILFYIGALSCLNDRLSLAVVGTRKCSDVARGWTRELVSKLTNDFTIVSGMAFGIDAEAHAAAISCGGLTVAVLASPPDVPTPMANTSLYRNILGSGGCVVSEFAPGTEVRPGMFASRNRIVAGLSRGVLMIEAGEKSGALITASLALDYNREAFALPGSIDRPQSWGCNQFIKEGKAKLVQDANDILVEFGLSLQSREVFSPENTRAEKLPQSQRDVFVMLSQADAYPEEIAKKFDRSVNDILSCLAVMELSGIVQQLGSGKFAIV